MAERLFYVYGVVRSGASLDGAPAGIDGAPVGLIADGELAALTACVDAAVYAEGLDDRVADVAWLAPRARAHDALMTWASDEGPIVPLPLFSLFRSEQAIRSMMAERRRELLSLLSEVGRGREYVVRIFRVDDELSEALASYSPVIAGLERDVEAAGSPGQRYLLQRKLEAARKDEMRDVAAGVAAGAYDALSGSSLAAVRDALPEPAANQVGTAILNASFLVARDAVDAFRAVVTDLVRAYDRRGFRLEFTGPWPPYHFARSVASDG